MPILINDNTARVQYTATAGQTVFIVPYEFFEAGDLKVYNGDTLLAYNVSPSSASQYSVTGAGVTGGGSITLGAPGAAISSVITIVRDIPIKRITDFPNAGPFNIQALNAELDKLTAVQQNLETDLDNRVLRLGDSDTPNTLSAIPNKAARQNKLLGFDVQGQPTAYDAASLATLVAYATAYADTFTGDGIDTTFTLSGNPAVIANLDVSINGVTQVPLTDYTLSGTTLTTTTPVPNGAVMLVKFKEGLPNYSGDAQDIRYTAGFSGAVQQNVKTKLEQYASVEDFGAVGDGVETSPGVWTGTDDTVALQAAAAWFRSTPGAHLTFTKGKNYLIYDRFDIIGASHATITGNGANLIQMSNNHTIFAIPGTSGNTDFSTEPVIDMVGNYDAGATEIVLTSVASIVVGDYLWVRSRQTITPLPGTPARQPVAEIVIVKSKDAGTNTITLEYPLSKDYIKDTVNVDPVSGLPYPHGVVLAENFARIVAEYLTIDNLNVIDTAGVLKFAVFLQQVFRCNLIDMAVDAGNGFIVRGAFVNMIRLQGKITAQGTPTYRGNYAIAPDTGSSHYLIDTPYFWSDNAFAYLHLHEGLSDIEVRGGTFMSATTTPLGLGAGFIVGVCQITGGCWGIKLTGQTFINSPTPISGLIHGVRVTNNETLMPGGIKGVVIERTKLCGTFNGSPILVDPVSGEGVDVIIPDVTEATSSDPWLISLLAPTCLLLEPRGDFTKIRNNGSRSRTYMRDKPMQLADFTTVGNQGPLITGRTAGQGTPPLWWQNTATNNNFNISTDLNGILYFNGGGTPGASLGTPVALIVPDSQLTANQDTNFWLLTRIGGVNTLKKVSLDAADSAGVGYRGLRVTN